MTKIRDEKTIIAFGIRVRQLRIAKSLTMEKFAEKAGIDYRQLSYIELGQVNPTISTASTIANALEISLSDLFDF